MAIGKTIFSYRDTKGGGTNRKIVTDLPQIATEEKIIKVTKKNTEILFTAKTIFPFDLFPTKINIYITKIDVIKKQFFYSDDIMSISIKNIATAEIQTALFMSTIRIISSLSTLQPVTINYLKAKDAIKIKKILDGLSLAIKEDFDLLNLDLKKFLSELK